MKIVSNKPTITRRELEGVLDCLINDELDSGNTIKSFEINLSNLIGLKYSLATNSITSSYHMIFHALQIRDDDEIIIPSYSNQSPLSILHHFGGKAVLVDNEENSLFPSMEKIKEKITEKTKAIIISHTFGFHFEFDELYNLNIPIIEDISHAVGTEINNIQVGSRATFAIISFAPSMIITTGNGGMVLTNNSKQYSIMRDLRGSHETTLNLEYTMTDFQGAMGISQLQKLKDFLKRRREIAKIFYDALRVTPHKIFLHYNDSFAFQCFPVIFDASIEKVEKYWKKTGIEILNPISSPLHALLGIRGLEFPNSDRLSKKLFAIPLYPTLSKKDIEKVSKSLSQFI